MKTFPDPIQAIVSGATGVIMRALFAGVVVLGGSALASFPEVDGNNVFVVLFLPAWLLSLTKLAGILVFLCLCTVWASLCAFIFFDCGKWTLLTLFSSALYAVLAAAFADGEDWGSFWEAFHWPVFFPLLAGLIFAIPDILNYRLRKIADKTKLSESAADKKSIAPIQSPDDTAEP